MLLMMCTLTLEAVIGYCKLTVEQINKQFNLFLETFILVFLVWTSVQTTAGLLCLVTVVKLWLDNCCVGAALRNYKFTVGLIVTPVESLLSNLHFQIKPHYLYIRFSPPDCYCHLQLPASIFNKDKTVPQPPARNQDDYKPATCCFPLCLVYCSQKPHGEWARAPTQALLNKKWNYAH